LRLQPGRYLSSIRRPQTIDRCYFKLLMLAPEPSHGAFHLLADLKYPDTAPKEFVEEFAALVQRFENHLQWRRSAPVDEPRPFAWPIHSHLLIYGPETDPVHAFKCKEFDSWTTDDGRAALASLDQSERPELDGHGRQPLP
jgi:hypothetical protein